MLSAGKLRGLQSGWAMMLPSKDVEPVRKEGSG